MSQGHGSGFEPGSRYYIAIPTAHQIESGYFILPRDLHREWSGRIEFNDFEVVAFGKLYEKLRLDQNYRIRVRLKEVITPGDSVKISVKLPRRLYVERG